MWNWLKRLARLWHRNKAPSWQDQLMRDIEETDRLLGKTKRPEPKPEPTQPLEMPQPSPERISQRLTAGTLQSGQLTKPRQLDETQVQWQVAQFQRSEQPIQLDLPLREEPHLKNRRSVLASHLTRLRMQMPQPKTPQEIWQEQLLKEPAKPEQLNEPKPREVSAPYADRDDPLAVLEVRNELTGQSWRFKDINSMYDQNGIFSLRGNWPPGLYRIDNKTRNGLRLTLWNETLRIEPGETWRLYAHAELGRDAEVIERRRMN